MANNGHKTPIFPSNPITLVSKNHHLSVFISNISSFPMVPMAMKPYKNPNLCSFNHHFHASFAGAQHTAEKKTCAADSPGIGCLARPRRGEAT
jgi:hypothetical protein